MSAGLLVLLLGFWATSVRAGQLDVLVTGNGLPAVDAVASLHSVEAAAATKPAPAVIDQRDTQFTPRVSVVHVGSQIRFPNSDNVRHQVYSFSPAKRFQLPLYSGKPASPVLFDKPGVVELGCNIHDWMVAYVVVVDTPYHAITDKLGRASLSAPPGRYRLRIWHPDLEAGTPPWEGDVVIGVQASSQKVDLPLGNRIAPQQPADDKLRALQEKFRALKKHDR
ncbi:MAG: methylamine utilization protein [Luteimonas sp.]|nr:methylamine utilization protein [Luteimonas sp.]